MVKKRKDRINLDDIKPTQLEKQIATHVRFNCPTKKTMLSGDEVHYFTGAKAVDCIMDSKWAVGKCKKDPLFTSRSSAVEFMQRILEKGMIWRARKLVPKLKNKEKDDLKVKKSTKVDDNDSNKKDKDKPSVSKKGEDEIEKKSDDKKKDARKRKVKLEFIQDAQVFKDGPDVYVWHFDPTSWTRFFVGLGIVLGSILLCLFPLWPSWLRLGVYYLSLCAMGLIGVLFGLIIVRGLVFAFVWICTGGKHHFWLLPNLTEDCAFFESFVPLYTHSCSDDKKRKEAKRKKSDAKEDNDVNRDQEDPKGDGGDTDNSKGDAATDESDPNASLSQSAQSSLQNTPQQQIRRRQRHEENSSAYEFVN